MKITAETTLTDLETQLTASEKQRARARAQTDALEQLVEFLTIKAEELGCEPSVFDFQDDARRIYRAHGLELPKRWRA